MLRLWVCGKRSCVVHIPTGERYALADWGDFTLGASLSGDLIFTGTPFTYDPGTADPLMQVSVVNVTGSAGSNSGNPEYLEADGSSGTLEYSVSYSDTGYNYAGNIGALVTRFSLDPVPEPASIALLAVALCATGLVRRRRGRIPA